MVRILVKSCPRWIREEAEKSQFKRTLGDNQRLKSSISLIRISIQDFKLVGLGKSGLPEPVWTDKLNEYGTFEANVYFTILAEFQG